MDGIGYYPDDDYGVVSIEVTERHLDSDYHRLRIIEMIHHLLQTFPSVILCLFSNFIHFESRARKPIKSVRPKAAQDTFFAPFRDLFLR